jgi:hypothetical protein
MKGQNHENFVNLGSKFFLLAEWPYLASQNDTALHMWVKSSVEDQKL